MLSVVTIPLPTSQDTWNGELADRLIRRSVYPEKLEVDSLHRQHCTFTDFKQVGKPLSHYPDL